jgi:hypothetical protein
MARSRHNGPLFFHRPRPRTTAELIADMAAANRITAAPKRLPDELENSIMEIVARNAPAATAKLLANLDAMPQAQ